MNADRHPDDEDLKRFVELADAELSDLAELLGRLDDSGEQIR